MTSNGKSPYQVDPATNFTGDGATVRFANEDRLCLLESREELKNMLAIPFHYTGIGNVHRISPKSTTWSERTLRHSPAKSGGLFRHFCSIYWRTDLIHLTSLLASQLIS